ncbi:MAG: beta-lactamase family protein [Acidimicrobiales bacterium]|nr:beta-lactamase family protein [Acidimicrobiales bacterium]
MHRPWVPVLVVGLVLALVAGGCGGGSETADDSEGSATATTTAPIVASRSVTEAELQAFADELVTDTRSQRAIVAWADGDEDPVVVTVGEDVQADDAFHVASITKSFVAAALVLLDADGTVELDAPVATYVDWPGGEDITVSQLLDHTSGLGPFGNPGDGEEDGTGSHYLELVQRGGALSLDEVLAATRDIAPVDEPGASATYSNLNYVVAGAVVKAATDEDVGAVLQERLFEPLGMDHTWYPPRAPGDAEPLPGLYELEPELDPLPTTAFDMEPWRTVAAPAAGAVSTLDDLLTWRHAVLREQRIGGVDVSAMTEIGPGGYGLGVAGVTADGACIFEGCPPDQDFTRWGLNGDIPGSSTRVLHDPTTDATLFVYLDRNALSLDEPMLAFVEG